MHRNLYKLLLLLSILSLVIPISVSAKSRQQLSPPADGARNLHHITHQ